GPFPRAAPVLAPRPPSEGPPAPSRLRRQGVLRVLGPRGVVRAHGPVPVVAVADGAGARARLGPDGPGPAGAPRPCPPGPGRGGRLLAVPARPDEAAAGGTGGRGRCRPGAGPGLAGSGLPAHWGGPAPVGARLCTALAVRLAGLDEASGAAALRDAAAPRDL